MIRIQKQQIATFAAASWAAFEDDLCAHLRAFFPAACEALGDAGVRAEIRYGAARAARHGVVGERDLFLYLDLVFALGRDFDEDPELPWVREKLADPDLPDPGARLSAIIDAIVARAAAGSGGEGRG
jgi:hypothetical protein